MTQVRDYGRLKEMLLLVLSAALALPNMIAPARAEGEQEDVISRRAKPSKHGYMRAAGGNTGVKRSAGGPPSTLWDRTADGMPTAGQPVTPGSGGPPPRLWSNGMAASPESDPSEPAAPPVETAPITPSRSSSESVLAPSPEASELGNLSNETGQGESPPLAPSEDLGALTAPSTDSTSPPAAAPEVVPAPETTVVSSGGGNSTVEVYETDVPAYQRTKPMWGIEIAGAYKALGKNSTFPNSTGGKVRAIQMQIEYQPKWLQKIGVIGLGPSVSVYPNLPNTGIFASNAAFWSVGGQARYQAVFFRNQWLVPMAGFSAEYVNYRLGGAGGGAKGKFLATGPFFGGMFLLNAVDPDAAAGFFIDHGVSRTYLLAELRMLSGGDSTVQLSGSSLFFGLRFEL